MSQEISKKSTSQLGKRYLLTGIFVLAPLAITVYILTSGFSLIDRFLGGVVVHLLGRHVVGAGAVLTLVLTLVVGMVATNVMGRRLIAFAEGVVERIPIVRTIYVSVKQLIDAFSVNSRSGFKRVVLVQYPRQGLWSIGFVTSKGEGVSDQRLPADLATVFVPTAPNPTSGFLLLTSADQLIELDMSVEEAFKVILSGGMVWGTTKETTQQT